VIPAPAGPAVVVTPPPEVVPSPSATPSPEVTPSPTVTPSPSAPATPQLTYRDPISVGPREDPNHWVEIADQLRRESVQRAQSKLGYQLKQATGGYDDQIVQSFLGEQAAQFDAEQGKIKDQARKLGGGLTVAMSVVETPRGPCFEPPLSDADVAGFLGKSSEAIGRMQESLGARGAARENTQEMLTRSQALAGAGERILNKFSYSEHLAQAGILGIALEAGTDLRTGGPASRRRPEPDAPPPRQPCRPRPTPTLRPRPTPTPKKRPTPTPTKRAHPHADQKAAQASRPPHLVPSAIPCADALKDLGVDPATAADQTQYRPAQRANLQRLQLPT
jgi:hypothetical protein